MKTSTSVLRQKPEMIEIVSTGMVTAVGITAVASCAAIRAGITGFHEIPFIDGYGKFIVAAPARRAVPGKLGFYLLANMAFLSIKECIGDDSLDAVPVIVAVSEMERPGRPPQLDEKILHEIEKLLQQRLHRDSCVIAGGGTASFLAIRRARQMFFDGRVKACLVCSVDSLINKEILRYLELHERLKTEGNPDGLIPGEAATCLYLSSVNRGEQEERVVIRGLGFAHEDVTVSSDQPILGLGLANAMREALSNSNLSMEDIGFRISDVSGERYGFAESNYALARVLRIRKTRFDFLHCSDCIGEVGAAGGACMLAYLKSIFDKGIAPHHGVLCETGSDNGDRAVAIVMGRLRRSA